VAASTTDIATLRRRAAEPSEATYRDEDIAAVIERFPLIDADDNEPDDTNWTATYDLSAAAAELWAEKAMALTGSYDFDADGGSYKRSQAYEQAMKNARYWGKRRAPASLRVHIDDEFERDYQANPSSSDLPEGLAVNGPEPEDYE
jgi:hypothetical protein